MAVAEILEIISSQEPWRNKFELLKSGRFLAEKAQLTAQLEFQSVGVILLKNYNRCISCQCSLMFR